MSIRLIIGADLVPTESNYELFEKSDVDALIGSELKEKLNDADFTIFNLEVPLTDVPSPIKKYGSNLIAPVSTISGIKAINPHFFTLANNHILDQDVQGLMSTLNILNEANIAYAGAGRNLEEAFKPYIYEKDGMKIGIYCCTEHEFSIATNVRAGANPFDVLESLDHISKLKKVCEYVIVLYHGGKEHYRYPSPYLQKVCRKLVDKGADLVVCQHSHCIGCEEKWNRGTIVYGQGNFLFDCSTSEYWETGILIVLDEALKINYLPILKQKERVRLAKGEKAEKILFDFEQRSKEIQQENFVKKQYRAFAKASIIPYLIAISGMNRGCIYRILNKFTMKKLDKWMIRHKYRKHEILKLVNYIDCEAHRELILYGIKAEEDE